MNDAAENFDEDFRDHPPTLKTISRKIAKLHHGHLPRCAITDERGVVVGQTTISNAYNYHKIRLTVEVILLNGRKEILVQRRSPDCLDDPLFWDLAAAGHVAFGESPRHAARRELREETGLDIANLKKIGENLLVIERQPWGKLQTYTHVFAARVAGEAEKIHEKLLEKDEVANAKWVSRKAFNELAPLELYALFAVECLEKTEV